VAIDTSSVQRWLDGYVAAWKSYDPAAIEALFAAGATYAWHPWDSGKDVAHGRAEIVKAWLGNKDIAGTYDAAYRPLLVSGDEAVATGQTRYFSRQGALKRTFYNLFVLRFDADGRCAEFTEWYMKRPS
jgi:hypothetical protein